MNMHTRRTFIKRLTAASVAVPLSAFHDDQIKKIEIPWNKNYSSFDSITVAVIGFGIMGSRNATTIKQINGVELVAVCDMYTGRLQRAKELFGTTLITTQRYEDLLDRKDIDA